MATDQPILAGSLPIRRGHLLEFARDPLACMQRLYREHGTIAALEQDGHRLYFVFGPEYNRRVLSDSETFHARFFALRGPKNSAQRRLTGALLGMNGAEHKRHRRLVQPPFQKSSIATYVGALAAMAEQLVGEWRFGEVRDLYQDMTRYMLRVASSILFGFDQPELAYEIGRETERWVALNHELGIGAFVPDERVTAGYERLLTQAEALEALIRTMIEIQRRSASPGNDVLSLLLRAHAGADAGLTDAELVGQTAILFAAAHMTTANSLTWMLFLLAQHPRVAAELVDELAAELRGEAPTIPELERLPMLDSVVKESMRVLPASFYVQRVSAVPVELGPFRLPRGAVVVFSQYMTHHMPDLFPEPERFLPDRWRTITPSPYAYLPFGAGPRLCLGGPLALLTVKVTLAVLLQRCRLSVVPGARIDGKVTSTMLAPASGMPMRITSPTAPFTRTKVEGNIHEMVTLEDRPPAM